MTFRTRARPLYTSPHSPIHETLQLFALPFARLAVISAKCLSLDDLSVRYRSSHRIAAFSYFGDPRAVWVDELEDVYDDRKGLAIAMRAYRIRYLIAIALVVAVGSAATGGAAGGALSSALPPVERVAQQLAPPGVKSVIVFVLDNGQEYSATAGTTSPAQDQRFRIGSVTKTFTATIVLRLVAEEKLRLSDTLDDYLPGIVPRGDDITIRQLLAHRSGLANFTAYPWITREERSSSASPLRSLRFAASKPLEFEPGSQFRYSNTNYIALGLVIKRVTGHSYARELEERILEPLKLDHTELPKTWRLPDLDDAGYNPNLAWAAGAIVSNARDISRFYAALLSGQILSRASLAKMKRQVGGRFGPGLGIWLLTLPCGRSWGHNGLILDYGTFVNASENGDRVAVIAVRLPGPPPGPPDISELLCTRSSAHARLAQPVRL